MNQPRFFFTPGYFADPLSQGFMDRELAQLDDICGPEVESLMACCDWRFVAAPVAVMACTESGEVLAIGWAGPTNRGDFGVNLTYAVARSAHGQGLATVVTSLALLKLDELIGGIPEDAKVHAQYDITNLGSQAVARGMGLLPDHSLGFRFEAMAGTRQFVGASLPSQQCIELARGRTMELVVLDLREVFKSASAAHHERHEQPAEVSADSTTASNDPPRQR